MLLPSAGLILGIIGSFVIALPDIPIINRKLRLGELKRARKKINPSGIERGEIGFDEVWNLICGLPKEQECTGGYPREIIVNTRTGLAPPREEIDFEWGGEYVEVRYTSEDMEDYEAMDVLMIGEVYDVLDSEIEKEESYFRGAGFIVLSVGFLLQLISIWI